MSYVDGNAAAGELTEIFGVELTAAIVVCAQCGASGEVAAARVYEGGMGMVLRCPECDSVLARVVHAGAETCLEMRGVRVLRWRSAG